MGALQQEWQLKRPLLEGKEIVSIYFGGGTPALLGSEPLREILRWIQESNLQIAKECEITLEVNPEEASPLLFAEFLALGINRLSLGIQSLDDSCLRRLGRTHTALQARRAIESAHRVGFTNLSIDLMTEIPEQTRESLETTLRQIATLPIQHLSLYNLTIEPNTAFARKEKTLKPLLPSPEECLAFLDLTVAHLEAMGLSRYEISAFGRPSLHNTGYWTARPFLGFGPSAFSYWNQARTRNIPDLKKYQTLLATVQDATDYRECLPFPRNLKELLAVRLPASTHSGMADP